MVQWLRLCTSNAGGVGSTPGQGTMIPHTCHVAKKKKNSIKRDQTTDTTEIQKTVKEYYEQLYTNKSDNQEEMDKFLETYNPPKLNQEEMDNLNRSLEVK